jgi:hypothetical protein
VLAGVHDVIWCSYDALDDFGLLFSVSLGAGDGVFLGNTALLNV